LALPLKEQHAGNANREDPHCRERIVPSPVTVYSRKVNLAVNFHTELRGRAVEVEDETSDRELAPELKTESAVAQKAPQTLFRRAGLLTKTACVLRRIGIPITAGGSPSRDPSGP
jgi:hypothetical protein